MPVTRIATRDDDHFLHEVYVSTRLDEVLNWGWEEDQRNKFLSMQWRMQKNSYQVQYPDSENLIISYEGLNSGRLMLNRTAEKIYLIDISLLPQFRNRMIGTALLLKLQKEGLLNKQTIELHVTTHNPARRLYERMGFQVQEILDFYIRMIWKPVIQKRKENES
jgi:ribosomal protein S18 acetylase RimI-like enzyme